jgi:hypothetical protein
MARLTAEDRDNLPESDFALPPDGYPIPDEGHAKAALSEISQHGTGEEKARVRSAVARKFKDMSVNRKGVKK